jgi:hypothetical protein
VDGEVKIRKGFFDVSQFIEYVHKETTDYDAIIHMRFATSGRKDEENCHPFWAGGGWAMGHNGILTMCNEMEGESDTAAFVNDYVVPIMEEDPNSILENAEWLTAMTKFTEGSKLAFLGPQGEFQIIHEEAGAWDGGIWYSNEYYKPYDQRSGYKKTTYSSSASTTPSTNASTPKKETAGEQNTPPHTVRSSTGQQSATLSGDYKQYEDWQFDRKTGKFEKVNNLTVPLLGARFEFMNIESICEVCNAWCPQDIGVWLDRRANLMVCDGCKDHTIHEELEMDRAEKETTETLKPESETTCHGHKEDSGDRPF